jgi:hypothetical protein
MHVSIKAALQTAVIIASTSVGAAEIPSMTFEPPTGDVWMSGAELPKASPSSDPTGAATVPRTETPNPSPVATAEFKFNLTLTIRRSDQPLENHPRRITSLHHLR